MRGSSCRHSFSSFLRGLLLVGVGAGLVLALFSDGWAQDENGSPGASGDLQEVYLSFEYAGVVNTMIEARYGGNQFYLSISDVFSALQIDYQQGEDGRSASGFFIDEGRTYRINLEAGSLTFEGVAYELISSDYVAGESKLFLRLNVFAEVFGMNFTPSFRQLSLNLEFAQETPVEAASQRRRDRTFGELTTTRPDFELLRDRRFHLVDGMVMDYGLRTTYSSTGLSGRYSLRTGAEMLGGDVQGNFSGNLSPTGADFRIQSGRWRLVTDTPILRQTRLGWIHSSGLRNFSLRGFQVTNEPVRAREMYGTYRVQGTAEPGWEVELYVNGQLIDVKEVDGNGQYFFDVPISYGTTRVTLREFGPSGQVNEENRRLDVPFSFVPKGRIYYSVEGGETRTPPLRIVQSEASVGITDWLTAGGGYEQAFDVPERFGTGERHPFGEFAARLAPGYVLSGTVAPGLRNRVSVNGVFPSSTSFELTYGRFYANSLYNRSESPHEVEGRASFPVPFLGNGGNLRLRSEHQYEEERGYTHRLRPSLSMTFGGGLRLRSSYQGRLSQNELRTLDFTTEDQELQLDFSYTIPLISGTFSPIGRTRLSLRSDYDLEDQQLTGLRFDLSRRIASIGRASLDLTHRMPTGRTSGSFRFTLDLPDFRSSSSARVRGGQLEVSQDVNGSLALDPRTGTLNFSNRGWVGQSSAALRMFVDVNGNDTFDEGEHVIEEGSVRFRRAVRTRTTGEGIIRTTGLQAYERYNVTVDQTSIPNPLWIPQQEEFSFVTDPNSFTSVDIPFYVAGVIEGTARKQTTSGMEPIPGLDVIVDEVDGDFRKTIDVFNEGSFYDYQIPPGNHVVYVDSTQLQKLGLRSDPPVHEFTVEHTEQGDQVSGLNFTLKPRGPEAPAIAEETEQQPGEEAVEQPAEEAPQQPDQEQPAVAEERPPEPAPEDQAPAEAKEAPAEPPAGDEAVAEEAAPEEAPEDAAAPAVGQDYFAIQLGAFSTYQTAQNYIEHSQILFDHPVTIRFKPEQELFAVEVDSFATRTAAAKLLETYQSRPYLENAFITEKSGPDPDAAYTIQIAAFSGQENAEQHADKMRTLLERPVTVRYKEDRGVYAVEMDSYGSRSEAQEALTSVRNQDGLASAFVVGPRPEEATPQFRYALQLGAYRNQEHARRRAELIRQRLRREQVDIRIVATADGALHRVLLNPSAERDDVVQLKQRLADRYGFTESYVTEFSGESEGSNTQ